MALRNHRPKWFSMLLSLFVLGLLNATPTAAVSGSEPAPPRKTATVQPKQSTARAKTFAKTGASRLNRGEIHQQSLDRKRSVPPRPTRKRAAPAVQEFSTDSRPCPSELRGPALSVLVIGDSLAVGVGMTLESAFQGSGRVVMNRMGKISTGLDSPRFYDWSTVLKEVLDRERYDLIVVMLGANDAHNSPGTETWGRQYEAKFSDLLRIPAEKQVSTLVVGLPPMRKEDYCQRVRVANEAIRNASRAYPRTCTYIDSFSRFADEDGNFTDRIRLRGEWKTVRAGDGVHFTGTGYQVLGKMVANEALQRSLASAGPVGRSPTGAKP